MNVKETGLLFTTYAKITSKWIKNLNIKSEILKLLEGKIDSKFFDICPGDDFFFFFFFDLTPKAKSTEAKINKWDYNIKLKSCVKRETKKKRKKERKKEKATYRMGENICKWYI